MYFFPAFAPICLGLLILAAVAGTFVTVYVNDLGASLAISHTWASFIIIAFLSRNEIQPLSFNSFREMDFEYTKFYSRATPYLMGIATGYVICGIQAKKIQIELKPVSASIISKFI